MGLRDLLNHRPRRSKLNLALFIILLMMLMMETMAEKKPLDGQDDDPEQMDKDVEKTPVMATLKPFPPEPVKRSIDKNALDAQWELLRKAVQDKWVGIDVAVFIKHTYVEPFTVLK